MGVQVQAWGPAELRGLDGTFPASSVSDDDSKLSGVETPPLVPLVTADVHGERDRELPS